MNLHGFERDFTANLELFVKKSSGWVSIPPLTTWSPRKTAAPERHRILGSERGLSLQTQIHLLDTHNEAFEIIENMVRIYLSPTTYSMLPDTTDKFNNEAEQVWLFAMRWLLHYYECLTEPLAIRTEFYKQSHVRFTELMGKMLCFTPTKRISFRDALQFWYPASTIFLVNPSNEEDSLSMTDPSHSEVVENLDEHRNPGLFAEKPEPDAPLQVDIQATNSDECRSHDPAVPVLLGPAPSASEVVVTPPVDLPASSAPLTKSDVLPALSVPSARLRLALKRPDGYEGRNKTRKSPRSSGRSPAIGNRGTRARG